MSCEICFEPEIVRITSVTSKILQMNVNVMVMFIDSIHTCQLHPKYLMVLHSSFDAGDKMIMPTYLNVCGTVTYYL